MSSATNLDSTTDSCYREFVALSRKYEFPEYVHKANLEETLQPQNLKSASYANCRTRQYPCHSAAATLVSAAYFYDNNATDPEVESQLQKFAQYHGIVPAYNSIVKQAKANQSNLSDGLEDYAYVWQGEQGETERCYPLGSVEQIKAAANWLYDDKDSLTWEVRHNASKRILTKLAKTPTTLPAYLIEFIEKQAGRGIPDVAELASLLQQRYHLAKTAAQRQSINKLAAIVQNNLKIVSSQNNIVKLAEALDFLDYELGLKGRYTSVIKRPEDVLFSVTWTKAASERNSLCELQTGNIYQKQQLTKLAREDLVSAFGEDFATEACTGFEVDQEKFATLAETLPRTDAVLLEKMLAEVGQTPQRAKAAAALSLTKDQLLKLAAEY